MLKSINKVIKTLIIGDLFLNSAWGLLAPIFAIFIVQNISFGNVAQGAKVAGFATLFYWMVKSLLQIPIGRYLDKNHGEKDDFWFSFLGLFLASFVPFGFLVSFEPWHIYILNAIHAVSMAMFIPSWYAIFTRHIDKGKEAFEWSMDSTFLGLGAGATAAIGGIMAAVWGFQIIFVLVGVLNMTSAVLFFSIRKSMYSHDHSIHKIPPTLNF